MHSKEKDDAGLDLTIASSGEEFNAATVDGLLLSASRRLRERLDDVRRPRAAVGVADSELGRLLVARSERGIAMLQYLDDERQAAASLDMLRVAFDLVEDTTAASEVAGEIERYLAGDSEALRHGVDLRLAENSFKKRVLRALMAVPRGALIGYGALGAAAGAPHSARAVGGVMHRNPVPIYLPCHRVIAADGALGGYGGGMGRKLKLLRSEGFAIDQAARLRLGGTAVYGHRRTRIYCRVDCRAARRADKARMLFFADARRAEQAGMRPCKLCRPA